MSEVKKIEVQDGFFQVHISSFIDEGAQIGSGTTIWHFSHIMSGAQVGKDCRIGQNVVISPKAVVGDKVKIQNNVSIYDRVILEDGVFCGPSCVFTNVINPRSLIERKHEYKETLVKKGATIGANATIVCGITLGRFSFVGAGSVVTRDVPDHALVYGNPARQKGWVCECGNVLSDTLECGDCQRSYTKSGEGLKENEK